MRSTLGISLPLNPHLAAVMLVRALGGVGSGNFDHEGRPGEVGGSGSGGASPSTISAVKTFTKGEVPERVNTLLRRGDSVERISDKTFVKQIDSSMTKLQSDTTLYRIMPSKFVGDLKKGDTFTDKGYVSTTKDKGALQDIHEEVFGFTSDKNIAALEIRAPRGMSHIDVNRMIGKHVFSHQAEVILPRGTKFRVVSRVGNVLVVQAL